MLQSWWPYPPLRPDSTILGHPMSTQSQSSKTRRSRSPSPEIEPSTNTSGAAIEGHVPYPSKRPKSGFELQGMGGIGTRRILATYARDHMTDIVELGSWMGRSASFLAVCSPRANLYCIDHWEGSAEHHRNKNKALKTLFDAFMEHTWHIRHRITAVRADTLTGMRNVHAAGVVPDLVFVDASHDYQAVYDDIALAQELWPEAQVIGDDWGWKQVQRAVIDYARRHHLIIDVEGGGWALLKEAPLAVRVKARLNRLYGNLQGWGQHRDAEARIPDTAPKRRR